MNLLVVIVNYGTPNHVLKNLDALVPELRDIDKDAKCWIVDNNSPDESVKIITRAIEEKKYHDVVTLIPFALNAGFGAGNNVAIRKARTLDEKPDYFYLLNPDAIILPGTVKKLANYLSKQNHVGIVGGPLLDTNGNLECGAFRLPSLRSTIEENLGIGFISRLWQDHRTSISPEPTKNINVGWVGGASMMVSAKAFEKAGLFDEDYFLYFEELDLCKRVSEKGFEIHYLPDAKVIHDSGASTGIHEKNVRLPEYWHRSRSRYFKKAFGENGLLLQNLATLFAGSIGSIYSFLRRRPPLKKHFLRDIWHYNFKQVDNIPDVYKLKTKKAEVPINPATIVSKRPHYQLRGNQLFFMASRTPTTTFTELEQVAWNALLKEMPLSQLEDKLEPASLNAIKRFIEYGYCDAFEPQIKKKRKKVLILEPHSDDAALSVGATMWQMRNECEFTLVTLGSTSNYTSYFSATYGPLKVDDITTIRNKENEIFMRYVNGSIAPANEKEATLRYQDGDWSHHFLKENRISVSAFNNHYGTDDERQNWQSIITSYIEKKPSDEIWIPMGVGTHSDHGITRDACIAALKNTKQKNILMYQDVPYDSQFKPHKHIIIDQLEKNGAILESLPIDISSSLQNKIKLLEIYGSQFKVKAIIQNVINSAKPTYASGYYEHFWKLHKLPEKHNPLDFFCGASYIASIRSKTHQWYTRNRSEKCIRLLLLMPSGQWQSHLEQLLDKFPNSRFDIVASPSSKAEVEKFDHPRINLTILEAGGKSWGKLMLKLLFAVGRPTLFISGDNRYSLARKIAQIWLQHDTIVSRTLEDLIIASNTDDADMD